MNILISDSWLKDYLKTKATPAQIAKYLTLCSQTVGKVTKKGNDWLYEIEITTNRPDCLSVYGIARELAAILPRFGIKAQLNEVLEEKIKIPEVKKSLPLEIEIKKTSLCPRFTALIFDKIIINPSPKIIQERLEKSGIRPLNNVVDISNYLMLELGQPMHTFDYDKIKGAKMILREAAGGEKITTLDGMTREIPDGAIIIEDGEVRIIDLCGIMGGKNSEVDENTKRVLLFIQTYDPLKIRQTCQALAFRTEAASRFEKGVDPEGVLLAMKKAVKMFKDLAGAQVASRLIDIYPHPPKEKKVVLSQEKLNQAMGIKIELTEAKQILDSLGLQSTINNQQSTIISIIPHWRNGDISIPEDLIEEVARIYGYHKLPSTIPPGRSLQEIQNPTFFWEEKVKDALKYWGFTEVMSYSMVSWELLKISEYNPEEYLAINNPLNEELVYMRPSLVPSLLNTVAQNQAENEKILIFELANVYLPKDKEKLPDEKLMLTGAQVGSKFYQIKGIIEALLNEIGIKNYQFEPYELEKTFYGKVFHPARTAEIMLKRQSLGILGEVNPVILRRFGIKAKAIVFDLEFSQLTKHATTAKKYTPLPKYPPIVEDLAFIVPERTLVGEIIEEMKRMSKLIQLIELIDSYKDTRTFRITYQSPKKTLSDKEIEKIRKKIIDKLAKSFDTKLKS